eukprot:11647706-Ditylum_brightwellii.AAC.1
MLKVVGSGNTLSYNAVEKRVNGMLEHVLCLYQGGEMDGSNGDNSASTHLMEILALQIQLYNRQK